jgi:hypothetical protein
MSLNEKEQQIWDMCVYDLTIPHELDPIERAANDNRLVDILQGVHDEEFDENYDVAELCARVAGDYGLDPEEFIMAVDIAKTRILREQA